MGDERTVALEASGLPVCTLRAEVIEGPDRGLVQTAGSDVLTVGTAPSNDLALTDGTVSRYHLDLIRHPDGIRVRDLGSTNGTVFAGARIERASVSPGVTLKLGNTSIRIDDGEAVTVELYEGDRLAGLIGTTQAMRRLMARIERVARSNSSVLVLGETGTGKERVARAIHERSPRAAQAYETVDCGAMLPTLVASELFGHERGAFTGADRQHIGAFERADKGTIFLDEIGELPEALQTALLGAIERRSFRRLGGKQSIPVDVRVVCATNRDLRREVNDGTFRQDLFYRVAVVTLTVPALRERLDDLPALAEHFLRQAGHEGPAGEILSASVIQAFRRHRWPGNVRELRNTVEAALVMGEPPELHGSDDQAGASAGAPAASGDDDLLVLPYSDARAAVLERFEARYLETLLDRHDGNVSVAARQAKMDRSYLTRMLKKHGLRARRPPLPEI